MMHGSAIFAGHQQHTQNKGLQITMFKLLTKKRKKRLIISAAVVIFVFAVVAFIASLVEDDPLKDLPPYSYSEGRNDMGYWDGVIALNYVELFEYDGLPIPDYVHVITEDQLDYEIALHFEELPPFERHIKNRNVKEGDIISVDYTGTASDSNDINMNNVKGEAILIGQTGYINCESLIGYKPGETVKVVKTYPHEYEFEPDWSNREITWSITINYIIEHRDIEDDDIEELFFDSHGWTTVKEMREALYEFLRFESIDNYIVRYFEEEVTVTTVPPQFMELIESQMIVDYKHAAKNNGMTYEAYLADMMFDNEEAMIEHHRKANTITAKTHLIAQAIAEDMELKITDDDIRAYYGERYYELEKTHGIPYMAQRTMYDIIIKYIIENAVYL